MRVAKPTGAPTSASARPCSMCTSTKALSIARRSGAGPSRPGSAPARSMACASVVPSASASARAASGRRAPQVSRLPTQATPKRAPSSSEKKATATGRRGERERARSSSTARKPETTPKGPSNAPPLGTLSRWLPVATAPGPGPPHQAHMLPLPSCSTTMRRAAASPRNHWRSSASAPLQANRVNPPSGSRPIPSSAAHIASHRARNAASPAPVTSPARRPGAPVIAGPPPGWRRRARPPKR